MLSNYYTLLFHSAVNSQLTQLVRQSILELLGCVFDEFGGRETSTVDLHLVCSAAPSLPPQISKQQTLFDTYGCSEYDNR